MLDLEYLSQLYRSHPEVWRKPVREFAIAGRQFAVNQERYLMGVVNLSPDSWYRESVVLSVESAIERGRVLHAQGAAIVDLGAESTLAHAQHVDGALQNSRLLPVIRELSQGGVLVSAETYNPGVAAACLEAGAGIINLTGNEENERIYRMAAERQAGVVICYVQGKNVRNVGDFDLRSDPMPLMLEYFKREIDRATAAGIERIFIDPGLGFYYRNLQDSSVRIRHQMVTFLNSFRLKELGWPICHALPHAFEYFREEVRTAEAFFGVVAALGGTHLFRTHEVPRVRAVLETMRGF